VARLPKLPCTQPWCDQLVEGGGKCEKHKEQRPNGLGVVNLRRIYDSARWKRLRAVVMSEEPLCRICLSKNIVELTRAVDHIEDMSSGGSPWDRDNLQGLCYACHNRKTAQTFGFDQERRNGPVGG
jgi:5-methylcytosine-specific restriction protein A